MDEKVYLEIVNEMAEGVYFVDLERKITFWNPGAEEITGYTAEEVIGHSCSEGILRHVNDKGTQLCLHGCPLAAVMLDGRPRQADVFLHHKEGHRVPVKVSGRAIYDNSGKITGSVELFSENIRNKFAQTQQHEQNVDVYTDVVTGVSSRHYGELNFPPLLNAVKTKLTTLGVLFMDIDYFKNVNDTFGHRTGDQVLKMVGQTVAGVLSQKDYPIRWGGEEFLVLLPGADKKTLGSVAEKIRVLVENSWLDKEGQQIRVTVSIGATLALPDETYEDCLERADMFMYTSKNAGRNLTTIEGVTLRRNEEIPYGPVFVSLNAIPK